MTSCSARRDRIEAELEQLAGESIFAKTIARLRCLRGISTLSPLGICAEVGEFERFDHPDSLAAYLGIVSPENTTGPAATPRSDHQSRVDARPPAVDRSRLPLPAIRRQRREDPAPPRRPACAHRQHRLARPAKAECSLAPTQAPPPQAQRRRRGRDRSRTRRLLLGDRPRRLAPYRQPVVAGGAALSLRALAHNQFRASGL